MRVIIQRVKEAKVLVENNIVGEIDKGLMVLLGVTHGDTEKDVDYLVKKVTKLRIFNDEKGKMNLSLKDIEGELLVVSQFTLYGNCEKGLRPSFTDAAKADVANDLYKKFIKLAKEDGFRVEEGSFGAHMEVDFINDGPVTLILDSPKN